LTHLISETVYWREIAGAPQGDNVQVSNDTVVHLRWECGGIRHKKKFFFVSKIIRFLIRAPLIFIFPSYYNTLFKNKENFVNPTVDVCLLFFAKNKVEKYVETSFWFEGIEIFFI
jgi:hypothetical protein